MHEPFISAIEEFAETSIQENREEWLANMRRRDEELQLHAKRHNSGYLDDSEQSILTISNSVKDKLEVEYKIPKEKTR